MPKNKKQKNPNLIIQNSKFKIQNSIRDHFAFIVVIVFLFLTVTFIYNETQLPLFQATSTTIITIQPIQPLTGFEYKDFYKYQARLQNHQKEMKSPKIISALALHPQVTGILQYEQQSGSPTTHKKSDTAPMPLTKSHIEQRIKDSLHIQFDHSKQKISVNVIDHNPKLATVIANSLPILYKNQLLNTSTDLQNELIKIKTKIIQSLDNIKNGPFANQSDLVNANQIRQQIKNVWYEQSQLYSQIREIQLILNSQQKYLPDFIENNNLSSIHYNLIQKQLELQTLKNKQTSIKSLLGEIGILEARFNSGLKKELANINKTLADNQNQEKNLMKSINQLSKGKTSTIATTTHDKLYQVILKQKSLDPYFTRSELVVLQKASEPILPIRPNKTFNLAIGFILGVISGLLLTYLGSYFKTRIYSEQDITKHLDLPVLGVIPKGR